MYSIVKVLFLLFALSSGGLSQIKAQSKYTPLKIGVVGLTHTHVHWILGRADVGDIEIVGIVEPNRELARRYADQHGYSMDLVFDNMQDMIATKRPEAVTAFGTIYDHLEVVETCAPLGIHVMVEKPLAVNMKHARKMAELARKHSIHLLTNYETTWYATNHQAKDILDKRKIGILRKVVVRSGHQGPKEIGVNDEFLDWLTDPVLNGGGALTDFGCYGANLITWLQDGRKPLSVFALTKTNKPNVYPKVDDEATIVLEYPDSQGIIQASWNWPFSVKDMKVYGKTGYVYCDDGTDMRIRLEDKEELHMAAKELTKPLHDPFSFFAAVIKGDIVVKPSDLSSLENNLTVIEILDAAKKSAKRGKRIKLRK